MRLQRYVEAFTRSGCIPLSETFQDGAPWGPIIPEMALVSDTQQNTYILSLTNEPVPIKLTVK
jgi:hypothetical protein